VRLRVGHAEGGAPGTAEDLPALAIRVPKMRVIWAHVIFCVVIPYIYRIFLGSDSAGGGGGRGGSRGGDSPLLDVEKLAEALHVVHEVLRSREKVHASERRHRTCEGIFERQGT
jgi:hypothetical protein